MRKSVQVSCKRGILFAVSAAVSVLGPTMGAAETAPTAVDPDSLPFAAVEKVLDGSDPVAKARACFLIMKVGREAEPLIPALLHLLGDQDWVRTENVGKAPPALKAGRGEGFAGVARHVVLNTPEGVKETWNFQIGDLAREAILGIQPTNAAPFLAALRKGPNRIRKEVARLVADLKMKEGVEALRGLQRHSECRIAATLALARLGEPLTVDDCIILLDSNDPGELDVAIRKAGELKDPRLAKRLREVLQNKKPLGLAEYRQLLQVDAANTLPILIQGIMDDNWEIREHAKAELVRRKDPRSVPLLIEVMERDQQPARSWAGMALMGVTGKQLGMDAKPWREWYDWALAKGEPIVP